MKFHVGITIFAVFSLVLSLSGRNATNSAASLAVPPVIQFSNVATDASGQQLTGAVPMTFSLYNNSQGGEALWSEMQNVSLDASGHYSVYLGITKNDGLPASLFTTGEAHWLGVKIGNQAEQPRVFLVSVPYAMKAGDAATVGGLPPSAFVLATPSAGNNSSSPSQPPNSPAGPNVGGSGTQNYIPLWTDNSGDLGNSILYQSGTTAVGIGTTTPASTLDVNGGVTSRGALELPSTGTATATQGYDSQPFQLQGSAFNGTKAIGPVFQLQAEPSGNNTSGAAGTLNLLYGNGSGQPSETGLNIASNGVITFAKEQTFPGAGTITGVTAGTGLTGGGTKGNVTLSINTTFANEYYAQLGAANTFTKNQTVNATMTATNFSGNGSGLTNVNAAELGGLLPSAFQPAGSYASLAANSFTGNQAITGANLALDQTTSATDGVITMGGTPFISACCASNTFNTFIGQGAGNFTSPANNNTAVGYQALTSINNLQSTGNTAVGATALQANLAGASNTAVGVSALVANTYGTSNTAVGASALQDTTTGLYNTSVGQGAGSINTGSSNTFIGQGANPSTGNLNYATAIGANAVVGQNNALVLGGTGPSAVSVGIGTPTPAATLDVRGTGNFTGLVTFAPTQTFPGAGTITGVTAGTDLTGGGSSGNVTLNLNTTALNSAYAQLATANSFSGNQTVNGNLSASGVVSGAGFQIGSNLFDQGSYANQNAFTGFAGNGSTTGTENTGVGLGALFLNSTGAYNTAAGAGALENNSSALFNTALGTQALYNETTGGFNTAVGGAALSGGTTGTNNVGMGFSASSEGTTGSSNTAVGSYALQFNTTGSYNTAVGQAAGYTPDHANTTGSENTFLGSFAVLAGPNEATLSNATAIGALAEVTASNSMVLGSIAGVNTATSNVNVGIGTTAPAYTLDVHGTGNFTGPVNFAPGQSFPEPNGSITNAMLQNSSLSVNPGTGLTGGGLVLLGGTTTLNVDTTKVPLLATNNTFTGNQTVNGNLSTTGMVSGAGFQIGSNLFDSGSYANRNAFTGFAGNTTMTGNQNTAAGYAALSSNTSGEENTAIGNYALSGNTVGGFNTALGGNTLINNSAGILNTALGSGALIGLQSGNSNTEVGGRSGESGFYGSNNTFVGASSGVGANVTFTGVTTLGYEAVAGAGQGINLNNATAIGANAQVAQSNAMVLGSINGVNNATADTAVGIGTTTPLNTPLSGNPPTKLNIVGNSNTWVPLVVQSASTFGTWMVLNNTSTGGKDWAILSAGPANGEGAGNLAITDLGAGGTIILEGNVQVTGNLSKGGGSFQIDHPLDPANKYLYHSFVESPDMMNIYNGVATLDSQGSVWITMPDYFEALNRDFRYQLTSIGKPQPTLYIAQQISGNRFRISGGKPRGQVSWQVTGIRHDAYANAHRIQVEEQKSPAEQGRYLHPELFGAPIEKQIGYRAPESPAKDQMAMAKRDAAR